MAKEDLSPLVSALKEKDIEEVEALVDALKKRQSFAATESLAKQLLKNEALGAGIDYWMAEQHQFQEKSEAGSAEDPICVLLHDWYGMDSSETKNFVLRFVPILLTMWIRQYHTAGAHALPGIEACLICIYNEEVAARNNEEKRWYPPSASVPSVYSERKDKNKKIVGSPSTQQSQLTEQTLKKLDKQTGTKIRRKVIEPVLSVINKQTIGFHERELITRVVIQRYVNNLCFMPKSSLESFCIMVERLCSVGFPFETPADFGKLGNEFGKYFKGDQVVTALSSDVMQEFVTAISYALFDDVTRKIALKAAQALHSRAEYELYPDVLLSTRALLHTVENEK